MTRYFVGLYAPDREPQRNRYTEEKRRSTFTEEVAATAGDGDLYYQRSSNAAQRFYMPIEQNEIEGLETEPEGGLLLVTHIFRKRWESIDGKWEPYDGGGNLVIKVRGLDGDDDLTYAARQTVESALRHTRLGRAIGYDGLRDMVDSLCEAFGIDLADFNKYEMSEKAFRASTDTEVRVKNALRELLTWAPERGYDEALGPIFAEADGVGFASDGVAYASLINGESNGFDGEGKGEPLPLLSEPVYYGMTGSKGDGRGFKSRLRDLMEAVGLEEEDLR